MREINSIHKHLPALVAAVFGVALTILLFPLNFFRRDRKQNLPDSRFDERDTLFARIARVDGTPQYEEYYSRNKHLKSDDDRSRSKPRLCSEGTKHYHPTYSPQTRKYFEEIEEIEADRIVVKGLKKKLEDSKNPDAALKEIIISLGAVSVGYTKLDREYIYKYKGRRDFHYGEPNNLDHPSAIIFLTEMDFDRMQRSPDAEATLETSLQYHRAAIIAITITETLKSLGYQAESNFDAHYDLILPPLAVNAGLGELGRNNILIADRYGSRVRIGAISTNFPLKYDSPIYLGAADFCEICKKCADNCPPKALSTGERENILGVQKWGTRVEQCYGYWRSIGTDCGVCMACCPFSHKNNLFHNIVRKVIPLNPWVRHAALWFDDQIYGRNWKGLS
ncbi:MAG: reductive dehalogenase domain-containing protein [Candidatus Electryonea clarkiae]|nr:reductive dehalogenase domain-containing protein [Candidatus Electryonea clarkiae]MDP8286213.1 reductive dehalogenase domain-containing protein [Candidatus Electryonea clarkiae]